LPGRARTGCRTTASLQVFNEEILIGMIPAVVQRGSLSVGLSESGMPAAPAWRSAGNSIFDFRIPGEERIQLGKLMLGSLYRRHRRVD
jgi:hypothetical protein